MFDIQNSLFDIFFRFPPHGRGAAGMSAKAGRGLYMRHKPAMVQKPLPSIPEGRNRTGPGLLMVGRPPLNPSTELWVTALLGYTIYSSCLIFSVLKGIFIY